MIVGVGRVAGLTVPAGEGTLLEMTSEVERSAIDHLAQRLCTQFPTVDAAVVARVVRETHHRFDAHPTREFVPILVEDAASDTLRVMPTTIARRRR